MSLTTVAAFWQQQVFASLDTYSFNRGPKSAAEYERLSQEIVAAKDALAAGRYVLRTKLSRQLRDLEEVRSGGRYNTLLTNKIISEFCTRKIATFAADTPVARTLGSIMRGATAQEAFAMCPPVYRDALVLRNAQGCVVRTLNICFECQLMATDSNQLLEADINTYEALRRFLVRLGHPIEY